MNKQKPTFPLIGKQVRIVQCNRYGKGYSYDGLGTIVGVSSTCVNIEIALASGKMKTERFLIRNGRRYGDGGAWTNDFFIHKDADIQLIKAEHRKFMPDAWCPRRGFALEGEGGFHMKSRNAEYCNSCADDVARQQRQAARLAEERAVDTRVNELCELHPTAAEAIREAFELGLRSKR